MQQNHLKLSKHAELTSIVLYLLSTAPPMFRMKPPEQVRTIKNVNNEWTIVFVHHGLHAFRHLWNLHFWWFEKFTLFCQLVFCTQNNSPRWRLTNEQLACYLSLSVTQPLSQTFGGLGRSARVREHSARNFPISLMSDVTIRFRAKLSVADWLNSFSVTRLEWSKEEMHGGM